MTHRWIEPATEAEARRELAAAYRAVDDLGWTDLAGTHLSCAVPGEDAYLVLAWGQFFSEVTASSLVKVGFDGTARTAGAELNPAGTTIHAGLYRALPRVRAILHTHTNAGVAASCHPDGLLPLSQHALRFYDAHGVHAYEGVALDDDEGPRLARDLGDHELLLLRNHGLLTVGADLPSAVSALYYAEIAAQMQLATLSSTADPVRPDHETCQLTQKQYRASSGYIYRDWLGMVRQVERTHAGFDD